MTPGWEWVAHKRGVACGLSPSSGQENGDPVLCPLVTSRGPTLVAQQGQETELLMAGVPRRKQESNRKPLY